MNGLISEFDAGKLHVKVFETRAQMGKAASEWYLAKVREKISEKGYVRAVFAAAHSQEDFFQGLIEDSSADFSCIDAFHMDEYIGLPQEAPQLFSNFLTRTIFSRKPFRSINLMRPEAGDSQRYAALLKAAPLDIVSLGIGENGHIAFNDPHEAHFDDPETVKVTTLDGKCRQQQVNDGCFQSLDDVPEKAMTLTIPTLACARYKVFVVPSERKAKAVHDMFLAERSEKVPASVIRGDSSSSVFLDKDSAALLLEGKGIRWEACL